ncbi:MAG: tRNA pseudouridine(38-40) synthase TruA [Oligoflexus sp.]
MNPACSKNRYRIDLAYQGTPFDGWQSQPSGKAVQNHLEKALTIFLREPTRVVGASRTDTGVHAEHQVAIFDSAVKFDCQRLIRGVNALLAEEIKIWSCAPADPDFHPIRDSVAKLYRYRLWLGRTGSPFVRDYVWPVSEQTDISRLQAAAQLFQGTHDFKSFCATDSSAKTTIRTIHEIWVKNKNPLVEIYIHGEGFLKQMVRSMVGTLVEVGQGRREIEDISAIIEQRDRTFAGLTAPAKGLSLVQIYFEHQKSCQSILQHSDQMFSFWIPIDRSNHV